MFTYLFESVRTKTLVLTMVLASMLLGFQNCGKGFKIGNTSLGAEGPDLAKFGSSGDLDKTLKLTVTPDVSTMLIDHNADVDVTVTVENTGIIDFTAPVYNNLAALKVGDTTVGLTPDGTDLNSHDTLSFKGKLPTDKVSGLIPLRLEVFMTVNNANGEVAGAYYANNVIIRDNVTDAFNGTLSAPAVGTAPAAGLTNGNFTLKIPVNNTGNRDFVTAQLVADCTKSGAATSVNVNGLKAHKSVTLSVTLNCQNGDTARFRLHMDDLPANLGYPALANDGILDTKTLALSIAAATPAPVASPRPTPTPTPVPTPAPPQTEICSISTSAIGSATVTIAKGDLGACQDSYNQFVSVNCPSHPGQTYSYSLFMPSRGSAAGNAGSGTNTCAGTKPIPTETCHLATNLGSKDVTVNKGDVGACQDAFNKFYAGEICPANPNSSVTFSLRLDSQGSGGSGSGTYYCINGSPSTTPPAQPETCYIATSIGNRNETITRGDLGACQDAYNRFVVDTCPAHPGEDFTYSLFMPSRGSGSGNAGSGTGHCDGEKPPATEACVISTTYGSKSVTITKGDLGACQDAFNHYWGEELCPANPNVAFGYSLHMDSRGGGSSAGSGVQYCVNGNASSTPPPQEPSGDSGGSSDTPDPSFY